MKWIPLRTNLLQDDRFLDIAEAIGVGPALGGLAYIWVICGQFEDGLLKGWTPEKLDRRVGVPGFSKAAQEVGWLDFVEDGGLRVPHHEKHMDMQQRWKETRRKREYRARDKTGHGGTKRDTAGQNGTCPEVSELSQNVRLGDERR